MKTRPAKIKILGKVYQIRYTKDAPLEEDELGMCDPNEQSIYVRDGQPSEVEGDTILHECLHALESLLELKLRHEDVVRITTGLHALIRDNPGLLAYLRSRNASQR